MQREAEVSSAFVELADTLVNDFDVLDFLHTVALHCVQLLDVDAAGVLITDNGSRLRVIAASTEEVRLLELFELQNDEGPCLESLTTGVPVFEEDLEASDRWPLFRREAVATGFRSVEAVPMRLRHHVIGAVNLFRNARGPLSEEDRRLCQALADVATIGLLQERTIREARALAEQLQAALNNRVVIEQAKGVVGERAGVEMEGAFEIMRRYARSHNLRLADVAKQVIDGQLSVDELGPALQSDS